MADDFGGERGSVSAPRRAERDATVITAAEMSYDDQVRMRKRRYLIAMTMRIPLLIAAAVAAATFHQLWLMFVLIIVSIPLPWIAVLIANDRPAQKSRAVVVGTINHERALPPPPREIVDSE